MCKQGIQIISSGLIYDEISFEIPARWKKIHIPFHNNAHEDFNDPDAQNLRIDFLRKELLPIKNLIPVRIFYPIKSSDLINPKTYTLNISDPVQEKNHISIFSIPLFAK